MIKIIKPGTLKEAICNKCGAVLSYDENEDLKTDFNGFSNLGTVGSKPMSKYILCPQCNNRIVIKAVR